MRTTGNFDAYLRSIDPNVMSVLLVKRSVLLSTKHDIQEVYDDLYVFFIFYFYLFYLFV